jgi:hypothetical protein
MLGEVVKLIALPVSRNTDNVLTSCVVISLSRAILLLFIDQLCGYQLVKDYSAVIYSFIYLVYVATSRFSHE